MFATVGPHFAVGFAPFTGLRSWVSASFSLCLSTVLVQLLCTSTSVFLGTMPWHLSQHALVHLDVKWGMSLFGGPNSQITKCEISLKHIVSKNARETLRATLGSFHDSRPAHNRWCYPLANHKKAIFLFYLILLPFLCPIGNTVLYSTGVAMRIFCLVNYRVLSMIR